MSTFSLILIIGILMVIGGISLMGTPLLTFVSAGYFIIILFLVKGIFGVIHGVMEKRYNKDFFFSVLSVILGIVGLVIPGAAAMNNSIMLYMAGAWFLVHAIMSIVDAIAGRSENDGIGKMILGIVLGVLELCLAIYSVMNPGIIATGLGLLIGLYYVESGVGMIAAGTALCKGSNNVTILYTIMGVLTVLGGLAMLATPLLTFMSTGYCIVALFFFMGVLGIVRGISEKNYDKDFFFSILSLLLGIIGFLVPGIASMSNSVLLFMAAGWFIIHGVMSIVSGLEIKKQGGETFAMVISIILGVLEVIMGVYSFAHPIILALSLGFLLAFYFIETGVGMIFTGSRIAKKVAKGELSAR
ncbi:MAG: DUF308 domain-containing protein [Clostridia bacterium]|nr:DUF308 domain-containing protein [Clostridia bacterium]